MPHEKSQIRRRRKGKRRGTSNRNDTKKVNQNENNEKESLPI